MAAENDKEDKKSRGCSDIIDRIDKYLSILLKAIPVIGLLASMLATISLFFYAHTENINIFSHYSSWVLSLPVIAFADILVALFLALLVFFPVFSLYYYINIFPEKKDVRGPCLKRVFGQFILLVAVPEVLAVFFVYQGSLSDPDEYFLIAILFYPVLSPVIFYFCYGKNISLSFIPAIPPFISFMCIVLFFVPERSPIVLVIWGFMLLVSFGWLYFRSCVKGVSKGCRPEIIVYSVALFVMFFTSYSTIITKGALRLLNVGGGVEKVYYVNSKDAKKIIPDEFLNDKCCIDNFCFTNKLSIIWGVGDLVYVDVPSKKNLPIKQHIAIPRKILLPYKLGEPLPDVWKTEDELKEAANQRKKEPK